MSEKENTHSKFHIVATAAQIAEEAVNILPSTCSIEFSKPYMEPSELAEKVRKSKADAILVQMGRVTAEVIQASPKLKVISKHGTGFDTIDVAAATALKIPVLIAAYSNYESVAEHVLGLMLSLAKDIPRLDARIRQGHWDKAGYRGTELFNKTLGIIGFGRIGRRLREIVAPLKMDILIYDPYIGSETVPPEVKRVEELEQLLSRADIVTVHCPLTEETRYMIGRPELEMMKRTAWLINAARGGIVNEKALIQSLQEGEIAAAALDTHEKEPLEDIEPLANAGKTLFTPHTAAGTEEAYIRMGVGAVRNILAVLEGEEPDPACLMNPEILDRSSD